MRAIICQPQAVQRVRRELFERECLDREIPVIITDALCDWEAINVWSPEYLASVLKHKRTVVAVSKEDRFDCSASEHVCEDLAQFKYETLDFITVASKIQRPDTSGERYYVMQTSIPDEFPELLRDIKTPKWVESKQSAINLWFG